MQQNIHARRILVLGASGLIGRFITDDLRRKEFTVVGVARRYSQSQRGHPLDLEIALLSMDAASLTKLLQNYDIDVVVNCLGVLQDGPGADSRAVHRDFVEGLLAAIERSNRTIHLVHISIPETGDDETNFSQTKREAEQIIAKSGVPYTILRPGFVIAPAAYGGSAMIRSLAALPVRFPKAVSEMPFRPVAIEDIAATVAWIAAGPSTQPAANAAVWDLMQSQPATLGTVVDQFRRSFGAAHSPRIPLPNVMLDLGAKLGDLSSWLGWMPPIRSTAIAELRRGVDGDPANWIAATRIAPMTLAEVVGLSSATIQDKWFARLFLLKALTIAILFVFWFASGFIALAISYDAAMNILRSHGFPPALVAPVTIGSSLMDMSIGVLIAVRRTSSYGLIAGILASLGYMFGSAVLAPDLWVEPLGALVKTGPAIALMLVALAISDNR